MSKRIFSTPNSKEVIFNKCPVCGEELEYVELYQYSKVYRILKNGKVSKTMKYERDGGPMECGFIVCTNCDFHTDCDYNTDSIINGNKIYIYESNKHQFMIDVEN